MLADCIDKCPDALWTSGTHPRPFWRIAFHTVYYTHLYLGQNETAYQKWPDRPAECPELWQSPWETEPYELPEHFAPYTKKQLQNCLAFVDALIDPTVAALNLDADDSGFSWYKNMSKLSHQLMNLRHLQGHVGQLSELLMARAIDTEWVGK